jgi:hypothetical protein
MSLPEMLDKRNALLARNGSLLAKAIIRAYHDSGIILAVRFRHPHELRIRF